MKKYKNLTTQEKESAVKKLNLHFPHFNFVMDNGRVYRADAGGGSDSDFAEINVYALVEIFATIPNK